VEQEMITAEQAYTLCFRFLEEIWQTEQSLYDDELPGLLGDMQARLDPALEDDWRKATLYQDELTVDIAFESMLRFLTIYVELGEGSGKDISRLLYIFDTSRKTALNKWIVLSALI
jgi:hypothetical protein